MIFVIWSALSQARWRCYLANTYYKKLKWATIHTQCRWRGRLGRKELRKLKMAARETGALKEAKDKLEKTVEDLTWRLQLEKRLRVTLLLLLDTSNLFLNIGCLTWLVLKSLGMHFVNVALES
ncbi:hypothetical protein KSS87_023064 [Heliosperma pusillum]|nr:hypothetical protein KSS87_023064 [Heliosperma pusillum]